MASRTFNFIEICAGGGMCGIGASAALQYLGRAARCVCHIERNGYAAATLVGRMEDAALDQAPVWDCLESFDCKPWRGLVDLAIATIPCQGNSVAGKRLLEDDERNLWPATRATLRDLECEYFFLENVPGMLIPDREGGRTAPILRVVGELAEDGWDAEWDVVSAEEVRANHRRERVFLLAHRKSVRKRKSNDPSGTDPFKRIAWRDVGGSGLRISGETRPLGDGCDPLPARAGSVVNSECAKRGKDDAARSGDDRSHSHAQREESSDGTSASGNDFPDRARALAHGGLQHRNIQQWEAGGEYQGGVREMADVRINAEPA